MGVQSLYRTALLILFAPGGPREKYFEALLHIGDMSAQEKAELFRVHDQFNL